jgi:hypothetical protein
MYKQIMKLISRRKRHPMAETIRGEGHPAFVEPKKSEVIIVRLSLDEKNRLRIAAHPLSLSAFIRTRLGLGGGRP